MPRRAVRSALALPFILAATVVAPSPASAAFDADGFAFQPFADAHRLDAPSVGDTPDGGYVVAVAVQGGPVPARGSLGTRLVVTRLDEDGAPVATWGEGGSVAIPGYEDDVSGVRVLADGSIALWSFHGRWLLRLGANGAVVREQAIETPEGADLQDGALDEQGTLHTFAVDFEANTSIVTSYGAGVPTWFTVPRFLVTAGAVDGQGRFVLASLPQSADDQPAVHRIVRLGAGGALDPAFGPATVAPGDDSVDVAVDSQHRVIVQRGLRYGGDWQFFRFTATGQPDPSFDGDGRADVVDADLGYAVDRSWGHVSVQDDGKVVATGLAGEAHSGNGRAILRLQENGARDTAFDESAAGAADGDGIVIVDRARAQFESSAAVAVDRGVAFAFGSWRGFERSMADAPDGSYVGLFRRVGPKAPGGGDNTGGGNGGGGETGGVQQQQSATPPPVTVAAQSRTAKTLRSCLSRRSFTIRLRPKALRSATVTVAGKKVGVARKNGRLTARVDLRKLEQATFEVQVVAVDARGRTVRETRSYRTCRVGKNGRKVKGGSIITVVQG